MEKVQNIVTAKNLYADHFKDNIVYVSSSEEIKSYTGDKEFFIGNTTLKKPEGIERVTLDNNTGLGKMSCIAIQIEVEIEPYANKEISINLGSEDNILDVKDIAYKYSKIYNCTEELNKVKRFWYELLTKVQVNTPLESMNILLNRMGSLSNNSIQTLVKNWISSISAEQSGFRDQLQDTIGLKLIDIEFMKKQILVQARHQFIEGDVEHWWHEETERGIRTRFSDDLLWLVYLVCEYISYTGDHSILDEEVPYVQGAELQEGVDESYDEYRESEIKESIYKHCIRAIEKSLNFGEHGIPKIGSGDWNDGLNTVGNKGKGESIWLGFFLYDILEKWIPIMEQYNELASLKQGGQEKYRQIAEDLKHALNNEGWDGRWYKRAYNDSGVPIRKYRK